ncbi:MAG: hypothetical protein QFX37_07440 [Archaeoglobales archaeon]|nr:hypothetical protein [Archaeoglobales archaeon]
MKTKMAELMEFLKSLRGFEDLKLLTESERKEILRIEGQAEKASLMGLMPGINQGVREALSRTFVLAGITNDEFEWPIKGTVRFVYKGEVIGEEIRDKEELEKLKSEGNRVIGDIFVLYSEKIAKLGITDLRIATLVIPPLELSWLNKVPHAKRVVVGSPSTPSDLYIKKLMNWKGDGGSVLIGFELD